MDYCIGDIHGCYKTLSKLIDRIFAQDNSPELYFVGDLIDRGNDTKSVIDLLIELSNQNIVKGIVKGNHEQMLLDAYSANQLFLCTNWSMNGAQKTVNSFKVTYFDQLVQDMIPKKYFEFLNDLHYYLELEKYFIVHAGFNFKCENPFEDFTFMLWTRRLDYDSELAKNKIIIHGHSPIQKEKLTEILEAKNSKVINIDTGCVYTQYDGLGYLTAFNMDTHQIISVKNCDIVQ